MTQHRSLNTFKSMFLQSKEIQKLIDGGFGPKPDAALGRFRSEDDGGLPRIGMDSRATSNDKFQWANKPG